jgi:hypothetical protein
MKTLVVSALLALVGCAQASREDAARAPSAAALWLEGVAEAHAEADARAGAHAQRALEAARARPVPAGVSAADRRRVLQDLQFRLAVLALHADDPARASAEAERGLALGRDDDTYTTNLLIVQGRAVGALGQRASAAEAYAAALAIHERLLQRALEGTP